MEDLFKITRGIYIILLSIASINVCLSQSNLVAHKISGSPYIEVNDSIKTLTKGTIIDKKTTLVMQPNDEVTLIDNNGEITQVIQTGKLRLDKLSQLPKVKTNSSTLKKYFSYFWKETTNTMSTRNNKTGVVYRGDDEIMLQFPSNNSLVLNPEIHFEWEPKDGKQKNYYFFLVDSENNILLTLGTSSTKLSLLANQNILKEGETYKWLVTETAYPSNISELNKYTFTLSSETNKEKTTRDIITLSRDLMKLGFKKENLKAIICNDFRVCF